jgi:uncharacterized repeat protein (TIGR01451 family)
MYDRLRPVFQSFTRIRGDFEAGEATHRIRRLRRLGMERLEDRTVLSVFLGANFSGLDFSQSGGYTPPDPTVAAGPSRYLEAVNQKVALYSKSAGNSLAQSPLSTFWSSTGQLARADSGSFLSDVVVAYNDQIGRFIIGDQDVDFGTHVSTFDLAVSKTSDPGSFSTSDWSFYRIVTTERGYDADFPGNFGYNHDALVVTLNMFASNGPGGHSQILSISNADLQAGAASPAVYRNDLNDFSDRPTVMHGSVAGDPMWLVTEHGDGASIDVIKVGDVLSTSPTFLYTNLQVTTYSRAVSPRNPDGTVITPTIDSRILKAAEANGILVACHTVSTSSTRDVVQWYSIDISGDSPALLDQGRVGSGDKTYSFYPSIDVNPVDQIGLTYMASGNDTSDDYMSMYVTGRLPTDPAGTMEAPVPVDAGTGGANYKDFSQGGRAGDLSGINVDPVDGSFWAANEFANTEATANWGTAVANFTLSNAIPVADMAIAVSGPAVVDITDGPASVAYAITVTNNGPNDASDVILSDFLPLGAVYVSLSQTSGTDSFTFTQSGGTARAIAAAIPSGHSDTLTLTVIAPKNLGNGAAFDDTASVVADQYDLKIANNRSTAEGTVINRNVRTSFIARVSSLSTTTEGNSITYRITVTNRGSIDAALVVLSDTLSSLLNYSSASTSQGTFSVSSGVVTFKLGTVPAGRSVFASVTAQALEDGTASDTVSVSGPNFTTSGASATTSISEPAIRVSPRVIEYGQTFTNLRTATFTHASGVEPVNAFVATINWGDGSTSPGTISASQGTYSVTGSHTYRTLGFHAITTTVVEAGSAPNSPVPEGGSKVDINPAHLHWRDRDLVQLPRYWFHPRRKAAPKHPARSHVVAAHPGGARVTRIRRLAGVARDTLPI